MLRLGPSAFHLIRPSGAPSPQGEGFAGALWFFDTAPEPFGLLTLSVCPCGAATFPEGKANVLNVM